MLISDLKEPVSSAVSLEMLANRVVRTLGTRKEQFDRQQEYVLKKALTFLDSASRGQQTVSSVRFDAASRDDLNAVVWAARASHAAPPHMGSRFAAYLRRLSKLLEGICSEGRPNPDDPNTRTLIAFFESIGELARDASFATTDVLIEE